VTQELEPSDLFCGEKCTIQKKKGSQQDGQDNFLENLPKYPHIWRKKV
jgi:hypothetical protein